jgi:hypothetical protein
VKLPGEGVVSDIPGIEAPESFHLCITSRMFSTTDRDHSCYTWVTGTPRHTPQLACLTAWSGSGSTRSPEATVIVDRRVQLEDM